MILHKLFLTLINAQNKNNGFTLLELLLASFMTLFVVSATGWGLIVMLRENVATAGSSDIQTNLNRALDFMADEAKSASSIYPTVSAITAADALDDTTQSFNTTGKTIVMGLDIGQDNPVVYYFRDPGNSSVWLGPNVLYRWGPGLCAGVQPVSWTPGGDCDDGSGNFTPGAYTSNWSDQELTDMIASTAEAGSNCSFGSVITGTGAATVNSPVFACVDATGKNAEIHAYASLEDEFAARGLGTSTDSRLGDKGKYNARTRVYARSTSDVTAGGGTSALTITTNAEATLARTSGTCTNYSISANGGSRVLFTDGMSVILQTSSPVLDIYDDPTAGTALNFNAAIGNANQAQYTDGTCTILATLTTP